MSAAFEFLLNGARVHVAGVDANTTLLAFLRARGLTGSKESCAEGECGACAVVVVVAAGTGSRYQAVNSCLVLLPEVADGEVWTVEGVRCGGGLHPVQLALVELGASQCGYCTPGFVMSLFAHYYAEPRAQPAQALAGNLCRCTGYRPIRDAAARLGAVAPGDAFAARLQTAAPPAAALEYEAADARFFRPTSLGEALELRAAHPTAVVLAGGTDLVVDVNQTGVRHPGWLALGAIAELRIIEERADRIVIGAGATWLDLEERLAARVPLFADVIPLFASPLIRARATIGGNLATASPVGDGPPVLLALDAQVELAAATGRRTFALADFFTGHRRTALRGDELLASVHVPLPLPDVARFSKVSKRELDDIAGVSGAFAVWRERGVVTKARLAFGGVAATPVRALAAEQELLGQRLDAQSLARCQRAAVAAFTPIDDVRASAAYRTAMVASLLAKFWHEVAP